jgi:hypothetical protein
MNKEEYRIKYPHPPDWWNDHGYDMRKTRDTFPPRRHPEQQIAFTSHSTHLKIFKHPRGDKYTLDPLIFGDDFEVRGKRTLTGGMLATAFDLLRDVDENEPDFAAMFGAEFGMRGYFLRLGPYLNISGPNFAGDRGNEVSIYLYDSIKKAVNSLRSLQFPIQHHAIRP